MLENCLLQFSRPSTYFYCLFDYWRLFLYIFHIFLTVISSILRDIVISVVFSSLLILVLLSLISDVYIIRLITVLYMFTLASLLYIYFSRWWRLNNSTFITCTRPHFPCNSIIELHFHYLFYYRFTSDLHLMQLREITATFNLLWRHIHLKCFSWCNNPCNFSS